MSVATGGGNDGEDDVDLYVKFDSVPSPSDWEFRDISFAQGRAEFSKTTGPLWYADTEHRFTPFTDLSPL